MEKKIYKSINKEIRKKVLLKGIFDNGPITREDIIGITDINAAAVYTVIAELLKNNLVVKSDSAQSTGGRKSSLLSINPHLGHVMGISIEQEYIVALVTDFSGKILARKKVDFDVQQGALTSQCIMEKLAGIIGSVIADSEKDGRKINSIGIGIPGVIDRGRTRGVFNVHVPDWENVPVKESLAEKFSMPIFIEQKNNLAAFAEERNKKNGGNLLYMNIDTGVGIGIIIDGEIYKGSNGSAGEFGHVVVSGDGRPCICGNKGCIESFISIPAIILQLKESIAHGVYTRMKEPFVFEDILGAYDSSDKLVLDTMKKVSGYISIGIVNLINIFNPGTIIIGGRITGFGDKLLDSVKQNVQSITWKGNRNNVPEIMFSKLGSDNQAIGAAWLAVREIL